MTGYNAGDLLQVTQNASTMDDCSTITPAELLAKHCPQVWQDMSDTMALTSHQPSKNHSSLVSATSISTTLLGSAYGSISEANTIGASVEQLLDAAVAHGCVAVTEQTETSEASGGSSHTRVAVTRQDSSMSFVSPAIEAGIEPVGDPALATPASVVASIRSWQQLEARWMEELGQQQGLVLPDDPHYLTAELRSVAVSWLIEVSGEFHLQQSTLFLAVLLLDRFLQRSEPVPRHYAQLVSVTCLFVAAKMEEERYPSLSLCMRVADNAFQANDILRMEQLLLNTLGFQLHIPSALVYMGILSSALELDADVTYRATFMAELCLLDATFSGGLSWCTAVACLLAALQLSEHPSMVAQKLMRAACLLSCPAASLVPWINAVTRLHTLALADSHPRSTHAPVREKYPGLCGTAAAMMS